MSMKSLKKDLVDLLKELILKEESIKKEAGSNSTACLKPSNAHNPTNVPNFSRGSLLISDIRNQIPNRTSIIGNMKETIEERNQRVAKGFQERMDRHRDSQIMKANNIQAIEENSLKIKEEVLTADKGQNYVRDQEEVAGEEEEYEPSPISTPFEEIAGEPEADPHVVTTWMEVSSPQHGVLSHSGLNISSNSQPSLCNAANLASPPTSSAAAVVKPGFVAATIKSLFSPSTSSKQAASQQDNSGKIDNSNKTSNAIPKTKVFSAESPPRDTSLLPLHCGESFSYAPRDSSAPTPLSLSSNPPPVPNRILPMQLNTPASPRRQTKQSFCHPHPLLRSSRLLTSRSR